MDWTIWPTDPVIGEWPWRVDPSAVVCRDTITCDPVPWARAGRAGARSFTPKRVREHEHLIAWRLKLACDRARVTVPTDEPLGLIAFFFVRTRARRDRDNLTKLVQDAGNKIIWADDSQIVEGFERIFYAPGSPRTELLVYRTVA